MKTVLQLGMIKEELPEIDFSSFEIKLKLEEKSPFLKSDFPGAIVRGSIMYKGKKLLCANTKLFDCKRCILAEKCTYARLFETIRPKKSAIMRKYKEIPHPFVLTPIIKGNEMNVFITLFGEYIEYFPYFYLIFRSLEKDKNFSLISIKNFDKEILKEDHISSNFEVRRFSRINFGVPASEISIEFLTPLRIKSNGKYVNQTNLKFKHIAKNLIRRLSLLSYFYGSIWAADFKKLIELAEDIKIKQSSLGWLEMERYSLRQKKYISMGGIVGNITFSGNISPFYKLLKIGEYTHIGKNTSFGHGYYKIK